MRCMIARQNANVCVPKTCLSASRTWHRRSTVIRLAICALFVGLNACSLVDRIPPRALTATTMWVCKRRIIRYAREHGNLPANLNGLPIMEGYVNQTTDAWGEPLQYEVQQGDIVQLKSLGADKKPGGQGDAVDMVGRFVARDKHGSWADELGPWVQDPSK